MNVKQLFLLVPFYILFNVTSAKIYEKCELARELKFVHRIDQNEIPTWVCIAEHESRFDTSAVNRGSGDHGLFQISDLYWCSLKKNGKNCNAKCSSFEDDDITDDVECIRRIFNEHRRITGDGFNAWAVYRYCKGNLDRYVKGCFEEHELLVETTTDGDFDYEFPPLPVFPGKSEVKTKNKKSEVKKYVNV